jgi:4-amino-4-deoxy-L-arabinose transferase-like glycosyltransferase
VQTIFRSPLKSIILLLVISSGTLFFRLGSLPLSGSDEPRYARIAEEMRADGNWITPTLNGKPWLEKPPLYYWMTIPFYSLFGVNETTARAGSALCALITVLAVFWLGSLLWTRQAGLYAALILLTSLGFAGFGRAASTDMPLTCCLTVAFVILAAAVEKDIGTWKVLPAYAFLGLAILAKGPVALILALGIGLCFWFLDEREVLFRRCRILPGLFVTAAFSIPWFWLVFQQNGYAFISTFFINHNLARFVTGIHHHSQPFYYYIPALLIMLLPWSGWLLLLVPKSSLQKLRYWQQWNSGTLFLLCWFLFPLLFFSLSDSKLGGYILPSLPPLALILGARLCEWFEGYSEPIMQRAGIWMYMIFSAAMAVAAPVYFYREFSGHWGVGLLLSIVILVPSIFAFVYGRRGNYMRAFIVTTLQGVLLIAATALFAFPVLGDYLSARDIAYKALEMEQPGEPIAAFKYFHHTLDYYTDYRIINGLEDLQSMYDFARKYPSVLVITHIDRLPELESLTNCSISGQVEQGYFRLLRLACK